MADSDAFHETVRQIALPSMEIQVPDLPELQTPMKATAEANSAEALHEKLLYWIGDFERSLGPDEEIGVRLVSFGQSVVLHVDAVAHDNPSLIVFHGRLDDGQKVTVIQHIAQLSFMLL